MPDSQKVPGFAGSKANQVGRLTMTAEPLPVPSWVHVSPVVLAHNPLSATPATTRPDVGAAARCCRLPHSDAMLARFPVTLTHDCAATGDAPCSQHKAVRTDT